MNPEKQPSLLRCYVPKPKKVKRLLGSRSGQKKAVIEHIYFDTTHPTLYYTGFLRGRRFVEPDASLFEVEKGFDLQYRVDDSQEIEELAHNIVAADVSKLVEERIGLTGVRPLFGIRFERITEERGGYRLDMDVDVTYFSLMASEPLEVGRELTPRLIIRELAPGTGEQDMDELLQDIDTAPCTAKKWMGFYYLKNCYELPRVDELAGYEYEVKLDTETLDFDVNRLPFPVLEVHQSDSLRRYYRSYRACVRGDSAHLVEKVPIQSIGGVLKRRETKKHNIPAWELPEPKMVMRRYKREINIVNPDSGRVYTLSLHYCDAGKTFTQVEIEYDGRLIPGAVTLMGKFMEDHRTEHLLTLANRADAAAIHAVGNELRERFLHLDPEHERVELVQAAMVKLKNGGEEPMVEPHVEAAVVDDMLLIRRALVRQGMSPSRLSKRKWLRRVYAELSE